MSDQNESASADESKNDDQIGNLKAEMARKLQNVNDANDKLAQQNDVLSQKLDLIVNQMSVPDQKQSSEDLEELRYTDPDRYIELKLQESDKRTDEKIAKSNQAQTAKSQVVADLAKIYPDINDPNSALYNEAIKISANYDANFMSTPEGIKLAVMEAASKLGTKSGPAKGADDNEDIDMSEYIGGGSGDSSKKSTRKKSEELDSKTIMTAKLMGLDVDDPDVIASLKKRANRKNFNRWE